MINIEYLAGFFDAEGCIGIYRSKGAKNSRYKSGFKTPCLVRIVSVTNTYRPILEAYKSMFGGWIHFLKRTGKYKPCYSWTVGSKEDIQRVLFTLLPYLQEKHDQASMMLNETMGVTSADEAMKFLKEAKRA